MVWIIVHIVRDILCSYEREEIMFANEFLFQNGINIVAYLNMGNCKTSNTRRISHCV